MSAIVSSSLNRRIAPPSVVGLQHVPLGWEAAEREVVL
jgi:hypothetical protein